MRSGPAGRIELQPAGEDAYGPPDASGGIKRFCGTWQVALAVLAARAESGSKALRSAAHTYELQEVATQARLAKVEERLDR